MCPQCCENSVSSRIAATVVQVYTWNHLMCETHNSKYTLWKTILDKKIKMAKTEKQHSFQKHKINIRKATTNIKTSNKYKRNKKE